jgi:predicted ABC-type ATPase
VPGSFTYRNLADDILGVVEEPIERDVDRFRPRVVLLGGPNGAGKTTVAPELLAEHLAVERFINADRIAEGLDAFSPRSVSLTAGRIMIERLRALAKRCESFGFETTLASKSFVPWIQALKTDGYLFLLFFLAIQTSDIAVARVTERVRLGGHRVDDEVIRRRFGRGIDNFFRLYQPLADGWWFYDNSSPGPPEIVAFLTPESEDVAIVRSDLWTFYSEVANGLP